MAGKKSYVVVIPLVITKKPDGSDLYLYNEAPVPESVSDDEIKRLLDAGFISDGSSSDKPAAESN